MAADNALVSNSQISNNPDLPVRSTATAAGELIQHMRLDVGAGAAESQVTAANPLPVTGSFSIPGVATEATLLTVSGNVADIETLVGTINSTLSTINTNVDGLEGLATTINTNVGTINTNVADIETLANTISTKLAASGASSIRVQGYGGAIATANPVPIAFQDLFGNPVVPTGLNAAGVIVMGVLPVDLGLNIQEFSPAGEVYAQSLVNNDDADSGGPIKIGGKAVTNNDTLTAVADADRANLSTDRRNRLIIDSDRMLVASATVTTTAETTIIAAPGAGIKIQVYKVFVSSTITSANTLGVQDFDGVEFRFGGAGSYYLQTTYCGASYNGVNKDTQGVVDGNTLIDLSQGHWDGGSNEKFAARRMAITMGNDYDHYITVFYRLMPT